MKRAVRSLFALVPLIGAAGLVGPGAPAAVAAPASAPASAPSTGSELFVSKTGCVPGGDGSAEAPFCTISAAAAVVQPGQTVLVQPGFYQENVSFTRSGTEAAPITFRAVNTRDGSVVVDSYNTTAGTGTIFTLRQVHDVVVEGFTIYGRQDSAIVVDASSRVTIDGTSITQGLPALIRVTGGSQDVTVSRNWLHSPGRTALEVDEATGTTVVANQIPNGGMYLAFAPDSTITNNTIQAGCGPGIMLGSSPGTVLANNIVRPLADQDLCAGQPTLKTAIFVGPDPTTTVAHHNLIDPTTGWALYRWGATTYRTLGDFQAATGQGAFDIAADPLLGASFSDRGYLALKQSSPAIDSADATARGVPATDMFGNSHADDPTWANTGTGNGFHDRGAVERIGPSSSRIEPLHRTIGAGPLDTTLRASTSNQWTTDGPVGSFAYKFSDSPLWRLDGPSINVDHRFRRAGSACVQVYSSWSGFRSSAGVTSPSCVALGAHYTAVAPTRLLDTRSAIGVGTTSPVAPNSEVVLPINSIGGVPAADISAVVLNVTATQPTASGFLTVYPDGTSLPGASNVNFVAKETVPNLVTVPMTNGKIRIRNSGGSGTVHVVADLQGWYGATGQGFATQTPKRVLDTRTEGGALPPNTTRTLDLDLKVSPGATAVVLNVTVTAPQANGVLKLFPYGSPVPNASNLNFVTGQTIPNLVIVPVTDLKLSIHNQSSGSTHVIADLAGYFGSDGQLSYLPNGPLRIADSRNATGLPNRGGAKPLQPRETVTVSPHVANLACCVSAAAVVANLTVTGPTASGFLIAHPGDEARPTASNVNFVAGETASNLAIVDARGGLNLYNSSSGTTHAIVDQAGIFITPQY